jgi:uncharacterized iron-regulated protein
MKKICFLLCSFIALSSFAQDKPAYVIFNAKGKKVSYKKMLQTLQSQDIVLIGEFHDNPISHWMELEITKDCGTIRQLVLGAEMFEQDNQPALDRYLRDSLSAKWLDSNARLWRNYKTDYAPLVKYAKDHQLSFAASNVPRKYASLVAKGGFESLDTIPSDAKKWMAPLPFAYDSTLPGYKKMKEMMPGHGGSNLPKAQALKDATMAHFILQYYKPGSLFIHYNGSYHSENHEGICWYLKKAKPDLKLATVSTVSQKNPKKLDAENKGKADFIICVDEDMTNTY